MGREEIHILTFSEIKLALFWRKPYISIQFFIFWKCMLSKISGSLFMVTLNSRFLLFFYHNQTHRTTRSQSTWPQKQALSSNTFTLTLFSVKFVFNIIVLKNGRSMQSKTQNYLSYIYHPPAILQNMFFFFHICSFSV